MQRATKTIASPLKKDQKIVGRTGTAYRLQSVLYERKGNDPQKDEVGHRLWLATSKNDYFVVKPVPPFLYSQAFKIQTELSFSPHIRLPVDGSDANKALIFQHYTEDFLRFMRRGPVPRSQVKRILHDALKGIAAFHSKDWVHSDVKPDNILISYRNNLGNSREIDAVTLSDTEDAVKLKKDQGIFTQVSNVLWRSPEAQAGTRVGKASDIWSFGVTALYGITRLVVFAYDELEDDVLPEVEVLSNMLSYFGPLPSALVDHVRDSPWCSVLITLDQSFDKNNPRKPFFSWRDIEGLEPGDKEFFKSLLCLDPGSRPIADELLKNPWFSSQ